MSSGISAYLQNQPILSASHDTFIYQADVTGTDEVYSKLLELVDVSCRIEQSIRRLIYNLDKTGLQLAMQSNLNSQDSLQASYSFETKCV